MIKNGVVNGVRKRLDPGRVVTGQLIGTHELYEFAHENDTFRLAEASYSNNARVVAEHDGFVSISSALEVDLLGQVNSEAVGGRYVAGTGGALDFATGARLSTGGRSIVALPSCTRSSSRIVGWLSGPSVTIPATLVDFVVTEHGVADLRGASVAERADRMSAVAAPHWRDWLRSTTEGKA
jgi:acetyl-CoA hydrolase